MGLKGDRRVIQDDISYFMNETATRGGIVSLSTGGSGVSLDQAVNVVTYAANSSGKVPIGMLQNDVVNYDLTRQILNVHKDEVQIGGKVTLTKKGWHVTDMIVGTPAAGGSGYLSSSGYIQTVAATSLVNPYVGRFMTTKDQDNFAKFELNIS